ncbi:thermonuclease family protein [Thalassobacter stenotrophicus]|uniref:Succinoglycan biosynthesis protein ExoI n=2 Tax=Thalassobacter stenotrophicus TaxID=266809 RepID=A0A0P1FJH5_9RHOB|nr:thermonuclease family protein [Thalassobacter stenotrophicus]CUH61624.1 Succinoglycan biosynthesis protein ExoI [Thalassobacter stenotrophicus]SHJ36230.1 Endonuclease YncB, thermonuclease family [Thalassobacter stenotrophicus DSM 16310]
MHCIVIIAKRVVELGIKKHLKITLALALTIATSSAEAREVDGTAYVRDADTIVVAGTPVRLNGVDAPETTTLHGRDAKSFMERLLKGKRVVCELNGKRTYDRWVGTCFINVDGQWADVGAIIIENGNALDCRRYSGGRYRSLEPAGARSRLTQARYC